MRAQEVLLEALHSKGLLTAALAHKASGDMQNTPLHAVVRNDHMGAQHAVQLLAKARADLEAQNEEGRTPLSLSMRRCLS
jgi:ankyrin repeat protein